MPGYKKITSYAIVTWTKIRASYIVKLVHKNDAVYFYDIPTITRERCVIWHNSFLLFDPTNLMTNEECK